MKYIIICTASITLHVFIDSLSFLLSADLEFFQWAKFSKGNHIWHDSTEWTVCAWNAIIVSGVLWYRQISNGILLSVKIQGFSDGSEKTFSLFHSLSESSRQSWLSVVDMLRDWQRPVGGWKPTTSTDQSVSRANSLYETFSQAPRTILSILAPRQQSAAGNTKKKKKSHFFFSARAFKTRSRESLSR